MAWLAHFAQLWDVAGSEPLPSELNPMWRLQSCGVLGSARVVKGSQRPFQWLDREHKTRSAEFRCAHELSQAAFSLQLRVLCCSRKVVFGIFEFYGDSA